MENKYLGIYHSADADGWCCAAIYKHKFGEDIEIIPYNYGQPVEHILEAAKGKIVLMADVTFSYENTLRLAEVAESLTICDHHEIAWNEFCEKEKEATIFSPLRIIISSFLAADTFDFHHSKDFSGCEILWNHLFENAPMPLVVNYIGIYDTGRQGVFDVPTPIGLDVLKFTYGLREIKYENKIDTILECMQPKNELFEQLYDKGESIKKYSDDQNNRVEVLCTEIREWVATLNQFYVVAVTNTTLDPSQFKPKGVYDFICTYYKGKDGWKYSLRPGTNQGKNPHLGEIASQFEYNGTKGGGHKNAAGFTYHKNIFE